MKLKKKVNKHDQLYINIVKQMKILQMSWICKENCHNKKKYCWINESDVYHQLTADYIICWSEVINKDDEFTSFIKFSRMLIEVLMITKFQVKHINSFSTFSSIITSLFTFIQSSQIINESISITNVLMLQMIQRTTVEEERKIKEQRINKSRWIVAISWRCSRRLKLLLCSINIDIHCLFILAILFKTMIFVIIFSDISSKLITLKHVLFDISLMSWMLDITIYKQYKAEKSMMKVIKIA